MTPTWKWRAFFADYKRHVVYGYLIPVGVAELCLLPFVVWWATHGAPESYEMPMAIIGLGIAFVVRVRTSRNLPL